MDRIIENVRFVEIDKSKKYIILASKEYYDIEDIQEVSKSIQNWLSREDDPVVILYGSGIKLLEVEK